MNVLRGLLVLIPALCCWVPISAQEPGLAIELPSTEIFSKGPNEIHDGVLEITRGRGAIIAWYVAAKETDEIVVSIEYSCSKPLNQEYQISFDGDNRFWDVEPTDADTWRRAELGTFRIRSGLPIYIQLVPPSGTKYEHPFRFSKLILEGKIPGNLERALDYREPKMPDANPGFGQKLAAVHPALTVQDLRAEDHTMRISGMAMRSERELIFTTWEGDLFSLDLDALNGEEPPPFRRIAQGLSEPMGLAVEGTRIFVTEKNDATELLDTDGDGSYETYRCISHDWPSTMDYHEYLFGAVVRDSHLYFSSSTAMNTRGIDNRQAPLRGSVLKVHIDTGATEVVAGGLRTPDGIGIGPSGSILVTDNQGEWLPANKLIHVQPGAFYEFRSRRPWHPLDRPRPTPPAVWLPQGEIAASPTEPILLPESWGPYAGQVIFGDATFGGLQRVSLEEVDGIMQGAVFPFSQGFQHLFHRFVFSSDGDLFAGGIARGKDWEFIRRVSGLTRIKFNGSDVFEPLSTKIRSNGIEIEFTQPLAEGTGSDPEAYVASQWGYQGTQTYGGSKIRHRRAEIRSATVSEDRRRVFLEISNLVEDEVLHVRLAESLMSQTFHSLWSGEFWYTVNRIPKGSPGIVEKPIKTKVVGSIPHFSYSEGNAGRTLYRSYCSACHSLDERKLVGPSFLEMVGAKRKVHDVETGETRITKVDTAYLKQSILEPNALIVDGYAKDLMPPVGAYLTDSQIGELISYIKKVSNPKIAKLEAARPLATVRDWSTKDFPEVGERWMQEKPNPSAVTRGKQAFLKAQCLQCHVASGFGATLGPDLVESAKTYRGAKLLKQIIEPSSELHPKYRTIQFLLDSGKVVVGSIIKEDEEAVYLATDLMLPQNLTKLSKDEIEQQKVSELSAMPQGLLNILTKQEILDLLSFLEAGIDSTMGLNEQAESLSEKGSDPLRRGQKPNEIDSPPKGQTPFRIGSKKK